MTTVGGGAPVVAGSGAGTLDALAVATGRAEAEAAGARVERGCGA